jgi:PadR family transcriptional regulator PadR
MSPIRLTQATALILRALATGRHHGFEIMDVSGLPSGTVYPVLRRLERELAVESAWEDEGEAREAGRPRRRVYELTESGQHVAERARQRLAETARLMSDPALGGLPVSGGDGS